MFFYPSGFTIIVDEGHIENYFNVDGATPSDIKNDAKNLFHETNNELLTRDIIKLEIEKDHMIEDEYFTYELAIIKLFFTPCY